MTDTPDFYLEQIEAVKRTKSTRLVFRSPSRFGNPSDSEIEAANSNLSRIPKEIHELTWLKHLDMSRTTFKSSSGSRFGTRPLETF
ncbi:MAG: hypothetical protein AAFR81_26015, partial [Chloroflexota bacterium]